MADKYDFDQDDGGGGSTKKSSEAGGRYMQHLEDAFFLSEDLNSQAVKAANSELAQKYTKDLLDDIGRKYIYK